MRHLYPGQDQKTGVVGNQMKMLCPAGRCPADELVPNGALPSRRPEEHAGQWASLGVAGQVL